MSIDISKNTCYESDKYTKSGKHVMRSSDIYQDVTNKIITLLESHMLDGWTKPWINLKTDNQPSRNPFTHNYYKGINQFLLSLTGMVHAYPKNLWMTYKQAQEMNGQVIKGAKATPIIFYKTSYKNKDGKYLKAENMPDLSPLEMAQQGINTVPCIKLYRVFNVAQISGLDPSYYETTYHEPLQEFEKNETVENMMHSVGARINISSSSKAYYDPHTDTIQLPLREQFKGQADPFYATAMHELGHWTGHHTRLDRDLTGAFGSVSYSREELIAELTSAMVLSHLGIEKTIRNSASYIKSWLGILKADSKAIIACSAQAQKASSYILERAGYET